MIEAIRKYFESNLQQTKLELESQHADKIQLASAALLIEVMNSDHALDPRELAELVEVLKNRLKLSPGKIDEVVTLAKREAQQATSLFEFTQLINANYDYDQKLELMEGMWRIAFSDEKLDKYEDHLIRKVADLIYVTHSDFIRTKLTIRDRQA